jgi:uncharacterized protein (DUF58 family)
MAPQAWLQLLFFSFLAGVLLRFEWLIYFSAAIAVVIGLTQFWRDHSLDRLTYTRRFKYKRGFPGETTEAQITVVNNKILPVSWVRVSDLWPSPVGPHDSQTLSHSHSPELGELTNHYHLRWYEQVHRTYSLLLRQRGVYEIGPAQIKSGDFFGMYEQVQDREQFDYLTVFPEILPAEYLSLPAQDPFGDRRARRPLYEDPNLPMGIRPYHPEDGFRHIHWPASARTGSLQTKVYQPVTTRTLVVCLNVSTTDQPWLGFSLERLEALVKVSATIIHRAVEDGYAVGLFSNGCLAHADQPFRFQPGKASGQLALLLQALAGVTPFTNTGFEQFLARSMANIPYGTTLVVVTSLLPESLQAMLVRLLRYRPNILLISLADEVPLALPGIRVLHLPPEERARWQS